MTTQLTGGATSNLDALTVSGAADFGTPTYGSVAMPRMVLSAAQNTTSGTAITFSGIPSWAKRITVMFNGVRTSGTSNITIQVGAGAVQTTGYTGQADSAAGQTSYTNGYIASNNVLAANSHYGAHTLTLMGSNTWAQTGILSPQTSANTLARTSGVCVVSGTLDRVVVTTANGTDTFYAGSVNILLEG